MSPTPNVTRWRSDQLDRGRAPLGVGIALSLSAGPLEPGDAVFLELAESDPVALAARLPPPVPGVTLVLGPRQTDEKGQGSPLARFFGRRPQSSPRGVRGSALLLAGYRDIGGGVDAGGLDLCWGSG
ncbi:MAG: hypothetical protein IPJ34_29850 [Myxococcales bacterium]|nr:hypothetical protein [Myxococcales bacterium]